MERLGFSRLRARFPTNEMLAGGRGEQHLDSQTISLITVPFFTGAIGYVTNWSGVWMLF